MRSLLVLALGSLIALAACDEPRFAGKVGVSEVVENIHHWDGKVVKVRGWLGECSGMNCAIYSTQQDAILVHRSRHDDAWFAALERGLSIASMGDFDQHAAPLQFKEVEITALVDDYCRSWNVSCTDRVPDLVPFMIEPVVKNNEN